VRRIIEQCYRQERELLDRHRDRIDAIAERLLERETLEEDELYGIRRHAPPSRPVRVATRRIGKRLLQRVGVRARGRGVDQLFEECDAQPSAVGFIGERLRMWLGHVGWPAREREDLIRAVREAVGNATEHAYPTEHPGAVTVRATV
jgi:hypothetical protein